MKCEILAPVGSKEALEAAIAAGADAVYFGLPNFGARAYANRFSLEETKEIIDRLHLLDMRVYITMNTILYEDEMEDAYEQAKALYKMNVDALIVQDLGLLELLHKRIPDLELHASTQLSVNSPSQIEKLKMLGVTRGVLARECTKEEIAACVATGVEIEVFVHGALCISYSGQCQFSKVRYNRSGNRGQCAQPCRMEYTLLENGKPVHTSARFLISPKDLSLLDDVKMLKNLGIASLKIEGRMKSGEYVYEAVEKCRQVLDGKKITKADREQLKVTFNRGYTTGHMFDQRGSNLMNMESSNHRGIEIGTVLSAYKNRIKIRLNQPLAQQDGIRFEGNKVKDGCRVNFLYDAKGKLISLGLPGNVIEVEGPFGIEKGSKVLKTIDYKLNQEIAHEIQQSHRQIPVHGFVSCKGIGEPLVLKIYNKRASCVVESDEAASKALKRPSDAALIGRQIEKTGSDFLRFESLDFDLADNIYFPIPVLNALRRKGVAVFKDALLASYDKPDVEFPYTEKLEPVFYQGLLCEIQKKEQLLDEKTAENITWISEFPITGAKQIATLTEKEGYVVSHLGKGTIIQGMNVTNSYALGALVKMGYQAAVLSDELEDEQLLALLEGFKKTYGFDAPVIKRIYQKRRLMIMKHCPVNTVLKDGTRKNCALCRQNEYTLEGKDGTRSILYGDKTCRMHIYDEKAENYIDTIAAYRKEGIHGFEAVFVNESKEEIEAVVKEIIQKLEIEE